MLKRRNVINQKKKQALYKSKPASVNMVKSIVNKTLDRRVEKKYFDVDKSGGYQFSVAGTMTKLSGLAQGVADNQRVGDQCKLKSLLIRGFISGNALGALMCRVIVFRWNDDDTVAPTIGDILQQTGTSVVVTSPYFFDQVRQGRFTVLKDKMIYSTNAASSNNYTVPFKIYRKIGSRIDTKGGSTNGKGHIYMLICSSITNATYCPNIFYNSRISYTDQ